MNEFSYLGVTKLLTVSQMKEPVPYLEKHAEEIARATANEVRIRIQQGRKKRLGKKKPKREAVDHHLVIRKSLRR